ncbi:MAG: SurA N-terminal domain-containing protein [Candidatus Omnitrophica bacterium]|nr:SurA N-terminal domain-containing protein [Candidatus Omnitrophota bacterium]
MLVKFKRRQIKQVIWVLIFFVIPAFILWGSISYLTTRRKTAVGELKGHLITAQEFSSYVELAKILYLLNYGYSYPAKVSPPQIESQAWQFYLLLKKAKEDKIYVSDEEVIQKIKEIFSSRGKFDKNWYFRVLKFRLRMNPRAFEESLRKILVIEKVWDKYIKVEVKDEEVLDLYKKDNQKAKIGYILIPYERMEKEIKINKEEVKKFYEENKDLFKEEPKVKIRYLFITQQKYSKIKEKLRKELRKTKDIIALSKKINLPYKETKLITASSPIEGIGWAPQVLKTAFSIPKNSLSKILAINNGFIVFEKIDEKSVRIPPFEEVRDKAEKLLKKNKQREYTKKLGEKIIKEIGEKKINDLKVIAKNYNLEYKETKPFRYYDYIEGVGLSKDLAEAVFRGKKGEIIPETFLLPKGCYIVQIKEIIEIDKKKFEEEKQKYKEKIITQKEFIQRLKFLSQLEEEFDLKIYSKPQQ